MIWDFAIVYLGVSLVVAGWYLGIINSWPAPIAMVLATAFTQFSYVNAGAFLLDQSRLPADVSFAIAYVILWIIFESIFEYALLILIPIKKRYSAGIPSRLAGAAIGFSKLAIVLTFAMAAGVSAQHMPSPPPGPPIAAWLAHTTRDSIILRSSRSAASHMPPQLAQRVVSVDSPIFKPSFEDQSALPVNSYRAQKWHELFTGLRKLENDLQDL